MVRCVYSGTWSKGTVLWLKGREGQKENPESETLEDNCWCEFLAWQGVRRTSRRRRMAGDCKARLQFFANFGLSWNNNNENTSKAWQPTSRSWRAGLTIRAVRWVGRTLPRMMLHAQNLHVVGRNFVQQQQQQCDAISVTSSLASSVVTLLALWISFCVGTKSKTIVACQTLAYYFEFNETFLSLQS